MDFSRTHLSGLLNGTAHEKTKYIGLCGKLKSLIDVAGSHKLILANTGRLLLTDNALAIFNSVGYRHPVIKILIEYLDRIALCANGSTNFLTLTRRLVDEAIFLLDNGVSAKHISDKFKDIIVDINSKFSDIKDNIAGKTDQGLFLSEKIRKFIKGKIVNPRVADLFIEAVEATRSFDVEKIRFCRIPTGSLEASYITEGMVLPRKPEGTVQALPATSVGLFNCALDINRTELKGTLLFNGASELMNFAKDETEAVRSAIAALDTNVLVVCGIIDPLFLEFCNMRNILVLRVGSKYDLVRICECVGGSIYNKLGPVKHKGRTAHIEAFKDGGYEFTRIMSAPGSAGHLCTIVLKCSVAVTLEETERSLTELLDCLKTMHESDSEMRLTEAWSVFSGKLVQACGDSDAICSAASRAILSWPQALPMFYSDQLKCIRYAFEFLAVIFEIDDYLVSKKDALDIKPKKSGHWDED